MDDFYNVLGVPRDAPPEAIRGAFRSAAKAAHPDAHPHLPSAEREALKRRFIRLAQAYETLSDPRRRTAYDRTLGPEPRTGAGRRTAAGPRARRASRPPPRRDAAPGSGDSTGETLDEMLRGVDDLLGRFGLDRRMPFEQVLDELLAWALALFREVVGAFDPDAEPSRPGPSQHASRGPRAQSSRNAAEPGGKTQPRTRADTSQRAKARPAGPRVSHDAALEDELRSLKSRVKSGNPHAKPTPDPDAELAELKRRAAAKSRRSP